jgi:predicted nucleic acid-binding protein
MRPYLETAVRIALALDHPAHDCIYIALAEAEGLRFVTVDASLVRKVARQPSGRHAGRVLGLADAATWQG